MLRNQSGFSLVETLVAIGLLTTAIVASAQLLAVATTANLSARHSTYAAILAAQKIEQLQSLTWGTDTGGAAVSDLTADTVASPEMAAGGSGLTLSPPDALRRNAAGYVDYVDRVGQPLGGGAIAPSAAAYTRRWSITALPTNPANTLVIQVLVTPRRDRSAADIAGVSQLPDEARLVTLRTRKGP